MAQANAGESCLAKTIRNHPMFPEPNNPIRKRCHEKVVSSFEDVFRFLFRSMAEGPSKWAN